MYDIVGKRNWYFALSALLTIPGLVFIVLGGLKPSIDFTGGTVWQARYESQPSADEMKAALTSLGHPDAQVRQVDNGYLEIRTEPIDLAPAPTPIPTPAPTPSAVPTSSGTSASGTPAPSASASASAAAGGGSPGPSPPTVVKGTEFAALQEKLVTRFGAGDPRSVTTVGPIIGLELIRSSAILIIIGELFILGYL